MEKRLRRNRLVRIFAFGLAVGLLLAVVRHAMLEMKVIQALFFD